jgi:dihydrofolate synthase/folylpolyglutamate synthase
MLMLPTRVDCLGCFSVKCAGQKKPCIIDLLSHIAGRILTNVDQFIGYVPAQASLCRIIMLKRCVPAHYQAALDYLYSFINYESKMPPSPRHARFNLDRMRWLLDELGAPERCFPSVVVAGTKGKGSTCAMLESILRAGGYRTGLFTSPHLHSWRERIQVNRVLITQDDVVAYVEQIKPIVARLGERGQPTVFELATAIALRYFADCEVDVAVLEVGLGGRFDTVNAVSPIVSAITPISFDHMAVLGNTLSEIAGAKAGIIKPSVPVVMAPQQVEAEAVIRAEAKLKDAPLYCATEQGLVSVPSSANSQTNGYHKTLCYPIGVDPQIVGLNGQYQLVNAKVALGVAMLLRDRGVCISEDAMASGLRGAWWPGRFEIVGRDPLIVLDGAMNGASAQQLRKALAALSYRRLLLVLGTSRDKDIDAVARELVPNAAAVVLTRSCHPRSTDLETLAEHVKPLLASSNCPLVFTHDIPPALEAACRLAHPDDLICVAGSLYVVAAAREALGIATEID